MKALKEKKIEIEQRNNEKWLFFFLKKYLILRTKKDLLFFINEDLLAIQFFQGCLQYETKLNSIHSFKRKEKRKEGVGFFSLSAVPTTSWLDLAKVSPFDIVLSS